MHVFTYFFFFCLLTFHKCFLKQNIHELWELRHPIANILKHSTVRNIQAVHLCLLKSSEFRLWLVVSLKKIGEVVAGMFLERHG